MAKLVTYWNEVVKEVKKVNWPTREELVSNTILVLVSSLIFALIIAAMDQVIQRILNVIYTFSL